MISKDNSQEKESSYTKKITSYLWETTLDQIDALARLRRREQPADIQRLAMHIGTLFMSIQGERGSDGNYGLWSDTMIREQIHSWVLLGDDWLAEQGRPLRRREEDGSMTTLLQVLMQGGHSLGGLVSEFSDRESGNSPNEKPEGDPLAGAKDFVLDADQGRDLNLDEVEIL